jgi:hypothetical protein
MAINNNMPYRIRCYTLFDITNTGVTARSKPTEPIISWIHARNSQCNFDTLLQLISLRSQPDVVRIPEQHEGSNSYFGSSYTTVVTYWAFEFEIQHASVFDNGMGSLGALYADCDQVPMIKCGTEIERVTTYLDTSLELKNIHFEIL